MRRVDIYTQSFNHTDDDDENEQQQDERCATDAKENDEFHFRYHTT